MNITEKIENLRSQIDQIDDEVGMQVRTLNEEITKQLQGLFNVDNLLQVKYTNQTLNFYSEELSKLDESNDSRALFCIYFRQKNYMRFLDKNDVLDSLELSYYTTSTTSDFELRRVYYLGLVAEIIRTRKNDILQLVNVYENDRKYLSLRSENLDQKWSLQREIKLLEEQLRLNEVQAIKDALTTTGIEFTQEMCMDLKKRNLYYRNLHQQRNYSPYFTALKITKISPSGKTCTVEYTKFQTEPTIFTAGPVEVCKYTMTEERVNLSKLLHALYYQRDKIK